MSNPERAFSESESNRSYPKDSSYSEFFHSSGDDIFQVLSTIFACAVVVIIALTGIVLIRGSLPAFSKFGFGFLTGLDWNPIVGQEAYGLLPYVLGTLVTSGIAIAIGIPVSLGI